MYCRNCGKEVLETDKFCANCGEANEVKSNVITEVRTNTENKQNVVDANNTLPMNWWNFWKYFRFPVGIFLTIINIFGYLPELEVNTITIFALITDIFLVVLMCTTYYHFAIQSKFGYKLLNVWIVIESVCNVLNATISNTSDELYAITMLDFVTQFICTFAIWALIWILPNYVYFNKRKHCFNDNNEDD